MAADDIAAGLGEGSGQEGGGECVGGRRRILLSTGSGGCVGDVKKQSEEINKYTQT
jgi:hypothetical protein